MTNTINAPTRANPLTAGRTGPAAGNRGSRLTRDRAYRTSAAAAPAPATHSPAVSISRSPRVSSSTNRPWEGSSPRVCYRHPVWEGRPAAVTVLDTIVEHKWAEIAAAKAAIPEADLEHRAAAEPPARDFAGALLRPGMRVIAEVKKASPSAGVIRPDFDPVAIARAYERGGADCLSVLTDEHFFQGHLSDLTAARRAT